MNILNKFILCLCLLSTSCNFSQQVIQRSEAAQFPFSFFKTISSLPAPVAAYISCGSISNSTEIAAVSTLYNSLVSAGLYSRFDRLQPISQTSLSAASCDLVSGTSTLTWVNAPTFSANGVTFDGATQYGLDSQTMDQYPIYGVNNDQGSMGVYVQGLTVVSALRQLMGAGTASSFQKGGTGSMTFMVKGAGQSPGVTLAAAFWTANKFSASNFSMYKNGSPIGNSSVPSPGAAPTIQLAWGCLNNGGGSFLRFEPYTIAFGFVGGSFTDAEEVQISTIINTYETSLPTPRNVY